jgi:hypothetical protein
LPAKLMGSVPCSFYGLSMLHLLAPKCPWIRFQRL